VREEGRMPQYAREGRMPRCVKEKGECPSV
jgi:hypothetical protein